MTRPADTAFAAELMGSSRLLHPSCNDLQRGANPSNGGRKRVQTGASLLPPQPQEPTLTGADREQRTGDFGGKR